MEAFTRSTFYKRQHIRGNFSDWLNLSEKLRGNTSLPHEIKRQSSVDFDAMLSTVFQNKVKNSADVWWTPQQDHAFNNELIWRDR